MFGLFKKKEKITVQSTKPQCKLIVSIECNSDNRYYSMRCDLHQEYIYHENKLSRERTSDLPLSWYYPSLCTPFICPELETKRWNILKDFTSDESKLYKKALIKKEKIAAAKKKEMELHEAVRNKFKRAVEL